MSLFLIKYNPVIIHSEINLLGFSVKNKKNPSGDSEIKIIGLRPGEKLYEELLVGKNPQKTNHPKIQKISDPFIPYDKLEIELDKLKILLSKNKVAEIKKVLIKLLKSYKSKSKIIDHIYVK